MAPLILDDKYAPALRTFGVPFARLKKQAAVPAQIVKPKTDIFPARWVSGLIGSEFQKTDEFYIVTNKYRNGEVVEARLGRKMLPSMNIDQMIAYRLKHSKDEELVPCSAPIFFNELAFPSYKGKANPIAREIGEEFLRENIRGNYPNLLTDIVYMPKVKGVARRDKVTHYDLGEKFVEADIVGGDGEFVEVTSAKASNALFGASVKNANQTFAWINGTSSYMYRVNETPETEDRRVVGLVAYSDGFYLICYWDPQYASASFGVCLSQKI